MRVVQIFVVTHFPEAGRVLPVDGRLFGEFLNQQLGFTLLLTIFGGAGLVANDLRTGAIVMYLARPLTRRDYVLGKLGVTLLLNLAVTLVPALAALPRRPGPGPRPVPALEPRLDRSRRSRCMPLVMSLSVSLLGLAASALTRRATAAGIGLFAFVAGLELVRQVLEHGFDRPEGDPALGAGQPAQPGPRPLRPRRSGRARVLDGLRSPWWPCSPLGCLLVLRQRVRAVEIVS